MLLCLIDRVVAEKLGQATGEGMTSDSARGSVAVSGYEELDELDVDNGSEPDGDGVVWPRSGLHVEAYRRKMKVWKNKIKEVGQIFASDDTFRHSMWKYIVAHWFQYQFKRSCL